MMIGATLVSAEFVPSGRVGESENPTLGMKLVSVPTAKTEPSALLSARVKVRPKAQLTLPEEIRRALHISEGDEVEFSVHDDGTITVRGYVSIPTDQAWFFTPEWLAGEREADENIAAGRGTVHESAEDMFAHLEALGAADG
jgi:AbrB family looped-hinge helix DNA binding protein